MVTDDAPKSMGDLKLLDIKWGSVLVGKYKTDNIDVTLSSNLITVLKFGTDSESLDLVMRNNVKQSSNNSVSDLSTELDISHLFVLD